jgi:glycosyltransferase involved in cell wall biosynthesis
MDKKKVLIVSQQEAGGVRRHVVELIENLDRNQFDVTLIYNSKYADSVFEKEHERIASNTTMVDIPYLVRELSPQNDLKAFQFISKWIQENKPDIVHAHSSKAGVVARAAAKVNHVHKVFYTPHAYSFMAPEFSPKMRMLFRFIEASLSRLATTKTFNVSRGEKQFALDAKLDKPNKFEVIYNGIPEIKLPTKAEARRRLGVPEEAFVIGDTSRVSEQKNPKEFLEIAEEVIKQRDNVYFVWVGDGPLEEKVENYIKAHQLGGRVKFVGFRDDSEEIVAAFDVYLHVPLYEGLPYGPIEALRAGVPIVASDVIGDNEIVSSEHIGMLFALDSGESQAEKVLLDLIDYKKKYDNKLILEDFRKRFSVNQMINEITQNYLFV